MRVSDIYLDAKNVLGYSDDATIFSRISDAVECLSNKGLIDAMQGYLEIPVTSSRIVTLPRDVETPVQVNVGNNPSFSRTKLYEFSMNGPGSAYSPTDWSWEDKGTVPVMVQPASASTVKVKSSDTGDITSYTVKIVGRLAPVAPATLGEKATEVITLTGTSYASGTNEFASIIKVFKSSTRGTITLATSGGTVLSTYAPGETEPEYRQIKLSQTGTTAHILFRRSVFRVSAQDDYIPIQSRMALLTMLRANESYRKSTIPDIQLAGVLEKQAAAFAQEEQTSRNVFADVASQSQKDSARNLNINNRDSLIMSDIYDDIAEMSGPVGQQRIFDRTTEALELLSNKSRWSALEGYVDLAVDRQSFVTLPRYVDMPYMINVGRGPSQMRNRWFEFHLNGPGSGDMPCGRWEDHGDVVTISDLTSAQGLVYLPDSSGDDGSTITVEGYDADDQPITITVAADHSADDSNATEDKIKRITRITREATTGFAQLLAYDTDGNVTQLGYYYPDETEPTYRRIKIPCSTCWIRMRYRKRAIKITSLTDPLHLKSRVAIVAAAASMAALRQAKPDLQLSEALEQKALRCLNEEELARNPLGAMSISMDTKTWGASPEHGQY